MTLASGRIVWYCDDNELNEAFGEYVITKEQYIEFLISTPVNYTCTNLANHISGVSHDSITDFLKSQRLTAESIWVYKKR